MATGGNEEEEMDCLIEEIERVMEEESGSGGATFGALRLDEQVQARAGGRVVASLNAAKGRRILTYKGTFLQEGKHDHIIITLMDPAKRIRRKQKARESKKKRMEDFKESKEKRREERAAKMAEEEAEKARLRAEGFYNEAEEEESDPPPPDSDSGSEPPPPDSDDEEAESGSEPPPPDSDDEDAESGSEPPPPDSDSGEGDGSDSDPPPPDSDSGSEPPPPDSDSDGDAPESSDGDKETPEQKAAREEAEQAAKKKREEDMAEWEKVLEKRKNVPTGDEVQYTYEELRMSTTKLTRDDINVMKRETYLTEEEFNEVFGMTRDEFGALATWKKAKLKSEKDLF